MTLPADVPPVPPLPPAAAPNRLNPKKLLLTKWTALKPMGRDKHFLVTRVVTPEEPGAPIEWVEIEPVMSRRARRIGWRELKDAAVWRQGWV
ncbi:MAG: TIGR02450 family Trp-rich protein [Leptothrix sp. (in: b-proteobacteria)]